MAKKKQRKRRGRKKGKNSVAPKVSDGTAGDDEELFDLVAGAEDNLKKSGGVRCTFQYQNGDRCKQPSLQGYVLCRRHAGPNVVGGGRGNTSSTGNAIMYRFKTEEWQTFFERQLTNPEQLDLAGEVAMIRTAAQMTMKIVDQKMAKIDALNKDKPEEADKASLAMAHLSSMLTQMSKDVSEVVEKAGKLQKTIGSTIDVRCITAFLETLVAMLFQEITDHDGIARVAARIGGLPFPSGGARPIANWPKGSLEREVYDRAHAARALKEKEAKESDDEEAVDEKE